jgi:3',5'-cyclic AMP phosphodiesterase CpdA
MIIAQIADPHIRAKGRLAYRKVDTVAGLTACVDHLNALVPRPDVVVMTGDLTDYGTPDEYAFARPILDRLSMPYFVVPGNHDEREAMRQVFGDHAYLPEAGFLNYVIEDYAVRLIGLDTVVAGEPFGKMCQQRLDWLQTRLEHGPDKPTLLFMHHPPFLTGIKHMDWQNCRNSDALSRIIARHSQVQMILCGHVHRAIEVKWAGTVAAIGPSPCHAVALDLTENRDPAFTMDPPACKLVYLNEDNQLVGHLSYIGTFDGPHPFFNPDGTLVD